MVAIRDLERQQMLLYRNACPQAKSMLWHHAKRPLPAQSGVSQTFTGLTPLGVKSLETPETTARSKIDKASWHASFLATDRTPNRYAAPFATRLKQTGLSFPLT